MKLYQILVFNGFASVLWNSGEMFKNKAKCKSTIRKNLSYAQKAGNVRLVVTDDNAGYSIPVKYIEDV